MGCDMYTYVEARNADGTWRQIHVPFPTREGDPSTMPFDWRNYHMYGFLAGVRVPQMPLIHARRSDVLSPRGGEDCASPEVLELSYHRGDHSVSWATVAELQAVDYDQVVTAPVKNATETAPLREWLGPWFFEDLDILAAAGDPTETRVIFHFSS